MCAFITLNGFINACLYFGDQVHMFGVSHKQDY